LGVEIEAPHPAAALHHGDEGGNGIDAKPEQRVVDAGPQRLEVGAPGGDLAAAQPPSCA